MYLDIARIRTWMNLVRIGPHVEEALKRGLPIVALESTVLTHGMPPLVSSTLGRELELLLRARGVTPATVGVVDGRLVIGMTEQEMQSLIRQAQARRPFEANPVQKLTARDLGPFLGRLRLPGSQAPRYGSTTVGSTLVACRMLGLRVFATGGLGGVHRVPPYDVSGDLPQLAVSPVIVVASGVKAILNVEATVEYLETLGIPVIGYKTDAFPVFYAREYRPKGGGQPLRVPFRADSPQEVVRMALAHWGLGLNSGVLVVVPPPERVAIPWAEMEGWLEQALREVQERGLRGPEVTPYLLQRLHELSHGRTMDANRELLMNNVKVAREIARVLYLEQREIWRPQAAEGEG